jgi:uncharacterized protein YerC
MAGYKKPPKDSQFKKGKSGNPKGRPKGSKNKESIAESISKEFSSKINLKNGETISKMDAAIKNFSNNMLKSNKLHELSKGIDILRKIEEDNKQTKLALEFTGKIIDEKYLDEEDVSNFAKGKKDPKFNYPEGVHKLYHRENSKHIMALDAVRKNQTLGNIYEYINKVSDINSLITQANNEMTFWSHVEEDILPNFNLNKKEKSEVISILAETREFPKADINVLMTLYQVLSVENNNLKCYMFLERDRLIASNYYYENEQAYLERNYINEALKEDPNFTRKELELANNKLKNSYHTFTNEENTYKFLELKDVMTDGELELLSNWLNNSNDKKDLVTYGDAIDKIEQKYG